MRWDYYSAGVPEVPDRLISVLRDRLGASECEERAGLHGYTTQALLRRGDITLARCIYGGNRDAMPVVWASGEEAVPLAGVLRASYAGHRVTRMDAAQDYDGPGTWDRLAGVATKHAVAGGLKLHQHGDWLREVDGRTLYLGSRKSDVFVRIYEKGKQLGADITGVDGLGGSPDVRVDWCRLEVQVRPQRDARYRAALSSPEEAWGYAGWTAKLLRAIDGTSVPRVNMQRHRIPDHESAFLHMTDQYASAIDTLRAERGWSWEELGRKIGELVRRKQSQRSHVERSRAA